MADLDDFFAKKDRKKAKGKKFTTTEEIAKKLEESGKRVEKVKPKEKPENPEDEEEAQQAPNAIFQEDDEWRVFKEEKKDYTGLKIGNLTVNENAGADTDDDRETGENSSDGEAGEAGTKHDGPWKKPDAPEQKESGEAPATETAAPTSAPIGGGVSKSYKAPHLRNATSSSSGSRSRMRNVAPDINSEEYFPTLSGKQPSSGEIISPWGRRKREEGNFEEVRNRGGSRGYSMPDSHQPPAPKLSLGNKYGALSQDQS